ncbi:hypothetical protein LSH36_68g00005 [Paralvinella palmiformis]|uniref:Ig-like domain-containing protein n=1 Tax=Paralvinella palmiformis TaxID=53620 RepID=A0AAD9NBF7_9ANNE|nr:hypothetical protein LSH36_68g00005 [Paralvinella palmiformis]
MIIVIVHFTNGILRHKFQNITGQLYSVVRPEGDSVMFSCLHQMSIIAAEAAKKNTTKKANITAMWIYNGHYVMNRRRYFAKEGLLYVYHLKPMDSGVIMCRVDVSRKVIGSLKMKTSYLVGIYSICVIPPKPSMKVEYRSSMRLKNNLRYFPYLDDPVTMYWFKDDYCYMKRTGLVKFLPKTLFSRQTSPMDSGIWRCIVYSSSMDMVWTTSCNKVEVAKKKKLLPLVTGLFKKVTQMPEFQLLSRWSMLLIFTHIVALIRIWARGDFIL